jgi:phosphate-selective porin OprO and OprP
MIRTWRVGLSHVMAGALSATAASAQRPAAIDSIRLQGYVQAQAEFGDATDTRFPANDRMFVRRARLYATGAIARDWEIRLMIDGAPGLTPRRDVPATLTEGYVRWKRYPAATVQVGQYKTPFTYEESHSASQLIAIERTLVVDRLKPSRQVGVLVAGTVRHDLLRYGVGVFNGTGTGTNANDNENFLYTGRASLRPVSGRWAGIGVTWDVGASGLTSRDGGAPFAPDFGFDADPIAAGIDNLFAGKRDEYALDSQLRWGRAEVWAEYVNAHLTPDDAIPVRDFRTDGWYLLTAFYAIPQCLQLVARVETFDQLRLNAPGNIESVFAGANYYLSRSHELKLQGGYMVSRRADTDGTAHRLLLRAQAMFSIL